MFAGGVAAGSSLLAAGAQLTGRDALVRTGRLGAAGGLAVSLVSLVSDLGRPERFLNMLRTIKLTSPMSVGTWLHSLYGAPAGVAALDEIVRLLPLADRKSTRLNSSHGAISYAVFCLKKKTHRGDATRKDLKSAHCPAHRFN